MKAIARPECWRPLVENLLCRVGDRGRRLAAISFILTWAMVGPATDESNRWWRLSPAVIGASVAVGFFAVQLV